MFKVGNYYEVETAKTESIGYIIGKCVGLDDDGYGWVEVSQDCAKKHDIGMLNKHVDRERLDNWGIELPFNEGFDYIGDIIFKKEYNKIKDTKLARKMYEGNIFKEEGGYIWVSK